MHMSHLRRELHYTLAEYIVLQAHSSVKHEHLDGEIYAMAGGTPDHAALAAALLRSVGAALTPPCRFFSSDLRVYCAESGLTTYPDATIVCGPTERSAADKLAVTNPRALFEITSPSTEDYDRGAKLAHYKQIASVLAVIIVSHREKRVSRHARTTADAEWTTTEFTSGVAAIDCVQAGLDLNDLYRAPLEDL
jgi:Uma2 family endonuclease